MTDDDLQQQLADALRNMVALERDRRFRFPTSELHMNSNRALRQAEEALREANENTEDLLSEDACKRLDLKLSQE